MAKRKYSPEAKHNEVINKLYASLRDLEQRNRQLQLALGDQAIDCTWEKFVKEIGRKNRTIATILNKAYVRRFERGRIWLVLQGLTFDQVFIAKHEMKKFLFLWCLQKFHQKFTIKIKIP